MNRLQESTAEMRKAGDRLMQRLSQLLGHGPINENRIRTRPDWKAVISVLRSCIRREAPDAAAIELLNQAARAQSFTLTAEGGSAKPVRLAIWGQLAVTVYQLAYYANCLAEDPRLKRYERIGACARCSSIFLKRRTNQAFCSNRCRSEAWGLKAGRAYFARKAKESRAARTAQHKASASTKNASSKSVVKNVVEFSPKPAKTRRKPRKA